MKTIFFAPLIAFCLSLPCIAQKTLTVEEWTREKDKVTIKATFVDFDPATKKVTIQLRNNKTAVIPVSVLIPEHQARVATLAKELAAKKAEVAVPRLVTVTPEGGGGHKIHIYKPGGYRVGDPASKQRPIALLYSPGGNSMSILNHLKSAAHELGWILVGVDGYKNEANLEIKYAERMKNTKAAYDWVEKNLSYDSKKMVFGGLSGGGWWSFQSASDLTQNAAGILSFGGWMGNMHDKKYSRNMAVAIMNGDKDKGARFYEVKDAAFLKSKAKAKVKLFSFPGGHVMAPANVTLDAARWIHKTKGFGDFSK